MNSYHLSKTRYTKGLQCEKQLWMDCNKPEEKSPYDQHTLDIFERGNDVGRMAWGLFPGGVLIANGDGYLDKDGAVAETQRALGSGAKTIYEAAFLYDNVYIFADILTCLSPGTAEDGGQVDQGFWDLYEVKSTGSVHEQHKPDIAVQYWVMDHVGMRPQRGFLTYIKGSQGMCQTQPWAHFGFEDLTGTCLSLQGEVASDVTRYNGMVRGAEPEIRMGGHCRKPYECMYQDYCRKLPENS